VHAGQSKKAREWRKEQYEQLSPLLWNGQVNAALAHLRALRPGGDGEPIDKLEETIIQWYNGVETLSLRMFQEGISLYILFRLWNIPSFPSELWDGEYGGE
jgi:hypothetical protein